MAEGGPLPTFEDHRRVDNIPDHRCSAPGPTCQTLAQPTSSTGSFDCQLSLSFRDMIETVLEGNAPQPALITAPMTHHPAVPSPADLNPDARNVIAPSPCLLVHDNGIHWRSHDNQCSLVFQFDVTPGFGA